MAKIFRTMLPDVSGERPKIGSTTKEPGLGVRVPTDISVSAVNTVTPGTGGVSVAPSLRALPPPLVPKRLRSIFRNADGPNERIVWSMGDGPFLDGVVSPNLTLRVEKPTHALIEPSAIMQLDDFQRALAETQSDWRRDEV